MFLVLERLQSSDQGTFGVIQIADKIFVTGELPWKNNRKDGSCIPEGIYKCVYSFSPRFNKFTYQLENVEDREGIRIHAGNFCGDKSKGYASHVEGCILIGKVIGNFHGQMAVLESRKGLIEFEDMLEKKEFFLEIKTRSQNELT